jgi:hypothetical protein
MDYATRDGKPGTPAHSRHQLAVGVHPYELSEEIWKDKWRISAPYDNCTVFFAVRGEALA